MYKVRVTYDFKNDMMFSWFYHSILYHVDGQKYEDKTEISKLSKSKQKLYHSLYDLVLSDVAYVINEGWADYTVEPKDNGKGGLFILDIDIMFSVFFVLNYLIFFIDLNFVMNFIDCV